MTDFFMDRLFKASLVIVLAAVIGLLFLGLSDPYDGFHGFQEAWYAAIAENYASHSFLLPTTYDEILDMNVPPFFSYLVYVSFSVFGSSEAAARIVPVSFSVLSLLAIFLVARLLVRKDAGLEAAAIFASAPIFLILGRNVQTDIVFVAFSLFFIYFYLRGRRSDSSLTFLIAGIFLGLSLFTKQFAAIPAAALVAWEALGPERRLLFKKNFLLMISAAGLVLAPYYGYHLLNDAGRLISAQLHGSASKAGFATGPTLGFLISELLWGCSPMILAGAIAGLAVGAMRLERKKLLVLLSAICFFLFSLFFHRHSYYFFGILPFLALGFTWLNEILPRAVYRFFLLISITTALVLSAYQSFGANYGGGELKRVGEFLRAYERPVVLAEESFILNYEPSFKYYAKNAFLLPRHSQLTQAEREAINQSAGVFSFSDIPFEQGSAASIPVAANRYGIKVGDKVFIHSPPNVHFFAPGLPHQIDDFTVIRSCGPFVELELVSFYLIPQPKPTR